MSYFSEMENTKWDWENFLSFGSKSAIESPNKLQVTDWMIVDKGEVNVGSFNVNTGASGSDGGHVSSSKSSVSASTDSSAKDGVQTSNFRLMSFEGFSRNFSKHREMKRTEVSQTSLSLDAAVGSVEPFIGLNLGKRTFFENSGGGGNVKGKSLSSMPTQSSTTSSKKPKSSGQKSPIPCCLVEGCNIDLSSAKEYHRKHKVCESHSKCPKVIVGGLERRFCQQCSRFHNLSEFDEKKRSCRRRLSDHNARRRKPQQETSQYNSRISSPFYGGSQSFLLNNSSKIHSRTPASSTWDSKCNPRFTVTKGYSLKSNGEGHSDEQLHMPEIKLPHAIDMHGNSANGLVAFRSSTPEVFSPGSKRSQMSPSQIDTAPEYRRALSLLSSNSNSSSTWVSSCGPESSVIPLQHHHQHPLPLPLHEGTVTHAALIPEGVSLSSTSSSDFNWLSEHHHHHHHYSVHPRVQSSPLASTTNFQEMQLLKTPYEPAVDFYFNILN